jgi:hypothetical protein
MSRPPIIISIRGGKVCGELRFRCMPFADREEETAKSQLEQYSNLLSKSVCEINHPNG